jgi:hypothetical protein
MTCLCVPAVFLACAAPSRGHKTTGLLGDAQQQQKISTASGTRGKVVAARAGMSEMDGDAPAPSEPVVAPDAVINLELCVCSFFRT